MTDLWEDCQEIRKEVAREYSNLKKSKGRPRTLDGILEKTRNLNDLAIRFEANVKKLEHRIEVTLHRQLSADFHSTLLDVQESLKILEETSINTGAQPRKGSNKHILDHLRKLRRASESDKTLKTPIIESFNRNHSIENLTMSNPPPPPPPYNFPMEKAIQCIPEFHGMAEELPAFLYQIKYFADAFPERVDQTPLLNVVYTKLRGEALKRFLDIQGDDWKTVEKNLTNAFKILKPVGSLMKEIETLEQGTSESYEEYQSRAKHLYRLLTTIDQVGRESYAEATLRRHFLGGLRSRPLALEGKSQREKSFLELLEWLKVECREEEELRDIHNRLHPFQSNRRSNNNGISNQQRNINNNVNHLNNYNDDRNYQSGSYNNNYRNNNRYNDNRNYRNNNYNDSRNNNHNYRNNDSNNQRRNYQENFRGTWSNERPSNTQNRLNNPQGSRNNNFGNRNFSQNNYNSNPSRHSDFHHGLPQREPAERYRSGNFTQHRNNQYDGSKN